MTYSLCDTVTRFLFTYFSSEKLKSRFILNLLYVRAHAFADGIFCPLYFWLISLYRLFRYAIYRLTRRCFRYRRIGTRRERVHASRNKSSVCLAERILTSVSVLYNLHTSFHIRLDAFFFFFHRSPSP